MIARRLRISRLITLVVVWCCLINGSVVDCSSRTNFPFLGRRSSHEIASITKIRGGASRSMNKKRSGARTATLHKKSSASSSPKSATGKKKVGAGLEKQQPEQQTAFATTMQKYKKILPLTRIYITMVGLSTALGLVLGEEMTQTVLSLDPMRTIYGFELWRPITAACFLGPPSIGWLMNGYYLFQYGSTLEKAYGSAQHLIFLLSQIIMLSILSMLLGQPFFASSMITSMLHVLSRSMPYQNVKWLVFTVPYWSLPYGLMATDVLQAQSAMAALPHILGIIAGHFYQFHKFVWPKMGSGHEDWLLPPSFISKRLDPNYSDPSQTAAKDSINNAIKGRKRQKGRKLGSSI
jgi:Derlin-1